MKKLFFALAMLGALTVTAQSKKTATDSASHKPKVFTITLDESGVRFLFQTIDASEIPHVEAEKLKQYILAQLQKQTTTSK